MRPVTQADLDNCAAEPIRIPGGIQPHGALLVIDPDNLALRQASTNASAMLGLALVPGEVVDLPGELTDWIASGMGGFLQTMTLPSGQFNVGGHRSAQGIIFEFEGVDAVEDRAIEAIYPSLQTFAEHIVPLEDIAAIGAAMATEVRRITGFNRVMVYQFDPEWHGLVVAEDGDGVLPSYLDLRFPASDIPAQARELYRLSPLRIIPNADYEPVPIAPTMSPVDGKPLDLSFAALRSVSPVHLEYMRNMGTFSSMSISIIVDDKLWGLISCHHEKPKRVGPRVRAACNLLAKIGSLRLSSVQRGKHNLQRIALKHRETELVAHLSRARSIPEALIEHGTAWLGIANAEGAAIVTETEVHAVGSTPPRDAIIRLADWLDAREFDMAYSTDRLPLEWPDAEEFADRASGIVAVSISQMHSSYVIWFRPEVVRTVRWGGEPKKTVSDAGRLTPRTSFAQWQEQLRLRALPWSDAEVESAGDFRNALINFVLRRAEERAELTEELQRANRELESFSYSISHDLRAPFRHIVGYAELLSAHDQTLDDKARHYLRNIVDAALSAGRLVDDLLNFSQLGRASLEKMRVDMNKLMSEITKSLETDVVDRNIEWRIDRLPPAYGDASLLRQALSNIVENAVKYTRDRDPAVITISAEDLGDTIRYSIADNGVGFDMAYVDKLFGVFQRLHRIEDFGGTGIGLALTKRIIERHGGRVMAEGEIDKGATFSFVLPKAEHEIATKEPKHV